MNPPPSEAQAFMVAKDGSDKSNIDVYDESGNVVPAIEAQVELVKGEKQPDAYRDKIFAILFYLQLAVVVAVSIFVGPIAFQDEDLEDDTGSATNGGDGEDGQFFMTKFMIEVGLCFVAAILLTMGALYIMTTYSHSVVKLSFFVAPISFTILALINLFIGSQSTGFFFLLAAITSVLSVCMYGCFRQFMSFAASNLLTALSALRMNMGTYPLSFFFGLLTYVWIVVWGIAIAGVSAKAAQQPQVACPSSDEDRYASTSGEMCDQGPNPVVMFLMAVSFYWTLSVVQNVLHTTTAGTVGTWWFTPLGDPSYFGGAVKDSFLRATTYSFGSICFGSLLVAIIQTLENMARNMRSNSSRDGGGLLLCIIECILFLIRAWVEYFNSWAFIYVALYGYDYLTAGKNVVNMFKSRGWTTYISDRLVYRVLAMCNVSVAALTGCIALLIDLAVGPVLYSPPTTPGDDQAVVVTSMMASNIVMFIAGFIIGLITSSTVLFVVESAVRTVIVCFAESPYEFQAHHPDLSQTMIKGWTEAYPSVTPMPTARGQVV